MEQDLVEEITTVPVLGVVCVVEVQHDTMAGDDTGR